MVKVNDFDSEADYYDMFEKKNQPFYDIINEFLIKLFNENSVKSVLDVTCGTGAQVLPLSKKGFDVVGCDNCNKLLGIARVKCEKLGLKIDLHHGDVRISKFGNFNAVISILNSMGYLS